jgi:hypothetical protein
LFGFAFVIASKVNVEGLNMDETQQFNYFGGRGTLPALGAPSLDDMASNDRRSMVFLFVASGPFFLGRSRCAKADPDRGRAQRRRYEDETVLCRVELRIGTAELSDELKDAFADISRRRRSLYSL